ncbi:molybdenum cofactor biosynthesis protein F-domain-containing protein, partial [Microdochium trichocladiopsis]
MVLAIQLKVYFVYTTWGVFVASSPARESPAPPSLILSLSRLLASNNYHGSPLLAIQNTMVQSSDNDTGYRPQEQWPTLTEMADGFHEHLMPASSALAGKTVEHTFSNGWRIKHEFDAAKLKWTMLEGEEVGSSAQVDYQAFEVRPGIFMIEFYKAEHEQEVTLILNTVSGQLKISVSGFADRDGERRTYTVFLDATKCGDQPVEAFDVTDELIGKHVLYRYTPRDAYQHFYVSPGTFMWHCLSGTEKDVADADQCKMFKLSDQLYLLFWTETIMPVESIVVVDLKELRSTGRFFCWDPAPKTMVRTVFGSQATIINHADMAAELAKPLR